jgi:hypothetical protein
MKPVDPFQAAIEAAERARIVRPAGMKAVDVAALTEEWRAAWQAEDPEFALAPILAAVEAAPAAVRQDIADLLQQRRHPPKPGITTREEEAQEDRRKVVDALLFGKHVVAAAPFFVLALRDHASAATFGLAVRGLVLAKSPAGGAALLSCVFHPPYGFARPESFGDIPGWSVNPGDMGSFATALFGLGGVSEKDADRLLERLRAVESLAREKDSRDEDRRQNVIHAVIAILAGMPDSDAAMDALFLRFSRFPVETRVAASRRKKPHRIPIELMRSYVKAAPIADEDLVRDIAKVNRVVCALELLVDGGEIAAKPALVKLRGRITKVKAKFRRGRARGEF